MQIQLYLGLVLLLYKAMPNRWKLLGMTHNKVCKYLKQSAVSSHLTIREAGKYTTLCSIRQFTYHNLTITCFALCNVPLMT